MTVQANTIQHKASLWPWMWFLHTSARHPPAHHPTKSLFTTLQNSLYSRPKCHTVLMLQNFLSLIPPSPYQHSTLTLTLLQKLQCQTTVSSCLSGSQKNQHCLPSLKEVITQAERCSLYWQNNIGCVLVTVCDVCWERKEGAHVSVLSAVHGASSCYNWPITISHH